MGKILSTLIIIGLVLVSLWIIGEVLQFISKTVDDALMRKRLNYFGKYRIYRVDFEKETWYYAKVCILRVFGISIYSKYKTYRSDIIPFLWKSKESLEKDLIDCFNELKNDRKEKTLLSIKGNRVL